MRGGLVGAARYAPISGGESIGWPRWSALTPPIAAPAPMATLPGRGARSRSGRRCTLQRPEVQTFEVTQDDVAISPAGEYTATRVADEII